jgi:hypothetical protein
MMIKTTTLGEVMVKIMVATMARIATSTTLAREISARYNATNVKSWGTIPGIVLKEKMMLDTTIAPTRGT